MPSQTRRFADVGATHQRWYCVCCGTRFRTKYGMLVEVHTKGVSTFMLAEVIGGDVEDIRAMFLENLAPVNPRDLRDLIPDFRPIDPQGVLRPLKPGETDKGDVDPGTISKFVKVQGLKDIPRWEWYQIFAVLLSWATLPSGREGRAR